MQEKIKKFYLLSCSFTLLLFIFISPLYALDLSKIKTHLLEGDYKSAITEGEQLLASPGDSPQLEELYYILGLSYLKDGNCLRASDIFEIILGEFRGDKFKEKARLGLGDAYFLMDELTKAEKCYQEVLRYSPDTELKAQVYYRFSQIGFKEGNSQKAKTYLGKLKSEFPLSPQLSLSNELYSFSGPDNVIYYTVQVGVFLNSTNANSLMQGLLDKGYSAYIEEMRLDDKTAYRVRAGKFASRQQATELESRLSQEGLPTKVFP